MEQELRHGSGLELSRRAIPGQSSEGNAVFYLWTLPGHRC